MDGLRAAGLGPDASRDFFTPLRSSRCKGDGLGTVRMGYPDVLYFTGIDIHPAAPNHSLQRRVIVAIPSSATVPISPCAASLHCRGPWRWPRPCRSNSFSSPAANRIFSPVSPTATCRPFRWIIISLIYARHGFSHRCTGFVIGRITCAPFDIRRRYISGSHHHQYSSAQSPRFNSLHQLFGNVEPRIPASPMISDYACRNPWS